MDMSARVGRVYARSCFDRFSFATPVSVHERDVLRLFDVWRYFGDTMRVIRHRGLCEPKFPKCQARSAQSFNEEARRGASRCLNVGQRCIQRGPAVRPRSRRKVAVTA